MTNIKPSLTRAVYFQVFLQLVRFYGFAALRNDVQINCFLIKYPGK